MNGTQDVKAPVYYPSTANSVDGKSSDGYTQYSSTDTRAPLCDVLPSLLKLPLPQYVCGENRYLILIGALAITKVSLLRTCIFESKTLYLNLNLNLKAKFVRVRSPFTHVGAHTRRSKGEGNLGNFCNFASARCDRRGEIGMFGRGRLKSWNF